MYSQKITEAQNAMEAAANSARHAIANRDQLQAVVTAHEAQVRALEQRNAGVGRIAAAQAEASNILSQIANIQIEAEATPLGPLVAHARKLSPSEIAHTKLLEEAIKNKLIEAFQEAASRLELDSLNYPDPEDNNRTLLMKCAIQGFPQGISILLARGVDANLEDSFGAKALMYLANAPHAKIFEELAAVTTNVNVQVAKVNNSNVLHVLVEGNERGSTLYTDEFPTLGISSEDTIYFGHNMVANVPNGVIGSIDLGPRADGYTVDQQRTMHLIKLVVSKYHGDLRQTNAQGLTPFALAKQSTKLTWLAQELEKTFGKEALSTVEVPNVMHILNQVAAALQQPNSEELLAKLKALPGFDINAKYGSHNTTLLHTVMGDNSPHCIPVANWLLANGAKTDAVDTEGAAPIHHAAFLNSPAEIYSLLHQHGGLVDLLCKKGGITALWIAAQQGNTASVTALLQLGANIHALRLENGKEVVHIATVNNHAAVLDILARQDPSVLNAKVGVATLNPEHSGKTPFMLACYQNLKELAHHLLDKYGPQLDISGALVWALRLHDTTLLDKLKALPGFDINATDAVGCSSMYISVIQNWQDMLQWFVDNKADVNKPSKEGVTPLYASLGFHGQPIDPELVTWLVEKAKADVTIGMNDGDTPMHMAHHHARIDIAKLFKQHNASFNTPNDQKQPPLYYLLANKATKVEAKEAFFREFVSEYDFNLLDAEGHNAVDWSHQFCPSLEVEIQAKLSGAGGVNEH